jgi:hypothetical protein
MATGDEVRARHVQDYDDLYGCAALRKCHHLLLT